jgi:hypothetical protein
MSDVPQLDRLAPDERNAVRCLFHALDWNVERAREAETVGRMHDARRHRNNVARLHSEIKKITDARPPIK